MSAAIAPNCTACFKPVSGQYFELGNGVAFHSSCFVCSSCCQEIGSKPFVKRDAGFVCSPCAEASRPVVHPPQTRGGSVPQTGGGSIPRGGGQEQRCCERCGEEILTVVFRELQGRYYHTDCFRCSLCNGLCGKDPVIQGDKPYCSECSEKGFLDICFKCKQPLNGGFTVALGQKYHKDCLKCFGCEVNLHGGSFYKSDDLPHCKECAEAKLSQPRRA